MKVIKVLLFLIITLICFIGCVSWPSDPYSLTENGNGTAKITFRNSSALEKCIQLISIDGEAIPLPKSGKTWNPVQVPAERPLTLILNLFCSTVPEKKSSSITVPGGTGTILDVFLLPVAAAEKMESMGNDIAQIAGAFWANIDVIINCPPLEVGKNYRLDWSGTNLWNNTLILKDTKTKKIIFKQEVRGVWQQAGSYANKTKALEKAQNRERGE